MSNPYGTATSDVATLTVSSGGGNNTGGGGGGGGAPSWPGLALVAAMLAMRAMKKKSREPGIVMPGCVQSGNTIGRIDSNYRSNWPECRASQAAPLRASSKTIWNERAGRRERNGQRRCVFQPGVGGFCLSKPRAAAPQPKGKTRLIRRWRRFAQIQTIILKI